MKMFSAPRIVIMTVISLMLLVLSACGAKNTVSQSDDGNVQARTENRLEQIKKEGKITIATGNYYPFEFRDETNTLVGYDVDLGNSLAKKLGVTVEWKEMALPATITTLQNKQADLIIAGLYITEERKEVMDMTDSYLATGIALIKRTGDTAINSMDGITGKKIGIKAGGVSEIVANDLIAAGEDFEIVLYKDNADFLMDLSLKRLDAAFNDYWNQLGYNKQYPESNFEFVGEVFAHYDLGIGVQKGETELLNYVNEFITEYVNSEGGKQSYDKWLQL